MKLIMLAGEVVFVFLFPYDNVYLPHRHITVCSYR